jgi:tripartite-type tricarboxylate transporter receptor subunit TctC
MTNNVLGGHIDAGVAVVSFSSRIHDDGQGRMLGVMSAERLDYAPQFATFAEAGYLLEWGSIRGFVAPAGLPEGVRDRLEAGLRAASEDPEYMAIVGQANQVLTFRDGALFHQDTATNFETLQILWEAEPWIN